MLKRIEQLLIIITFSILFTQIGFAQVPDTLWTKTYGGVLDDRGKSIAKISNGTFVIIGKTDSFGAGEDDIYLVNIDQMGDTIWTKTYGGIEWDEGEHICATDDGGFIITGSIRTTTGGYDFYVLKADAQGDSIWSYKYDGGNTDKGQWIDVTDDNGYIAIGKSEHSSESDICLIKLNSVGDTVWTKLFGDQTWNEGRCVIQTPDGGYIGVGDTEVQGNGKDVFIIKTNSSGELITSNVYGGSSEDRIYSIEKMNDNNYILAGYSPSFHVQNNEIYLIKTDTNGDSIWTKTIGINGDCTASSIKVLNDGNFVMTGGVYQNEENIWDVFIVKTNANGDTLWTKTIGDSSVDFGNSVEINDENSCLIAGVTRSFGSGDENFYVINLNIEQSTSMQGKQIVLDAYNIYQNYPNPFNPSTKINYTIPKSEKVKIEVFNLLGQKITTLLNKQMPAGLLEIEFTVKDLPSGVYLYRIEAGEFQEVEKMVLIR